MKLYVANLTKQTHSFCYRIEGQLRFQDIPPGGQSCIANKDLTDSVVQKIIDQHAPYGMVSSKEVSRAREFVGRCFSIDKPVQLDPIEETMEHNDRELDGRAAERREESAAAISQRLSSNLRDFDPNAQMQRASVETIEETRGTPSIAEGTEVVSDGVAPRHKGTKSRRERRSEV